MQYGSCYVGLRPLFHPEIDSLRHNYPYDCGLISFTVADTRFANSNRSSTRAMARPCACSTKGSCGPRSVQQAGKEARRPAFSEIINPPLPPLPPAFDQLKPPTPPGMKRMNDREISQPLRSNVGELNRVSSSQRPSRCLMSLESTSPILITYPKTQSSSWTKPFWRAVR